MGGGSSLLMWGVAPKQGEEGTWGSGDGGPLPCFLLHSAYCLARYYECACFLFFSCNICPSPPPKPPTLRMSSRVGTLITLYPQGIGPCLVASDNVSNE